MGEPAAGVIPLASSARASSTSTISGRDGFLCRRRLPYRPGIQLIGRPPVVLLNSPESCERPAKAPILYRTGRTDRIGFFDPIRPDRRRVGSAAGVAGYLGIARARLSAMIARPAASWIAIVR